MNVYDFDQTILKGDSEDYFLQYIIDEKLIKGFKLFKFKKLVKNRCKTLEIYLKKSEVIYKMVALNIKDLDSVLEMFWDKHEKFIKPFYKEIRRDDDIISTATPTFVVKPIFERLGIKNYIGTEFDFEKMCFVDGLNYAEKKPVNLIKKYGNVEIDTFYSDSNSDVYLARLAKKAIKVKGEEFLDWDTNK